jgi:ABC-type polysaccharide/polyol phosphate export permease
MAIYTLRTSLGTTIHFLITLAVAVIAVSLLHPTNCWTPFRALWAVGPAIALLVVFAWAIAAILAIANVFFHDCRHLAELGFGICFFLTPIVYPRERLAERGFGFLVDWNPVVVFFDVIREPILSGVPPTPVMFAKAFGIAFGAVIVALALFARFERRIVFHL